METIFNFSEFHLKKKEENRKQMIIENRYLQLLNLPQFFLKKKLISNVKKKMKNRIHLKETI